MVGTKEYIYNIIGLFESNRKLGLLIPPLWLVIDLQQAILMHGKNFGNTQQLCRLLNIHVGPNANESPIAIGTTFWARVSSLKKLIQYDWKYENFLVMNKQNSNEVKEYLGRNDNYLYLWKELN